MIKDIQFTTKFKQQASKAISAVGIFILTYILLLGFALALTAVCLYAGFAVVMTSPGFLTIILGAGLASLGILILFFLLKFLFKFHRVDRSHLHEIKRKDEPELFALIDELVEEVGTEFPKKVYLSSDVNASVFYDSSFWSMFFPIKKNLNIGIGLVNAVSREEFKAILAHEFGHFSQKTMKIGSYVYNVNQIIYNMLFDNEGYDRLISRWASFGNIMQLFVALAVLIIRGIQWILGKVYGLINKRYMALSREMEFHADEIAANVTGYEPLAESLLRLDLANQAYTEVLNYYGPKVALNIKSNNIYQEQSFVMNFIAQDNNIPLVHGFPNVSIDEFSRFNKSKLNIEDQWASHPSTKDRIAHLKSTNINATNRDRLPANTLFQNIEATQKLLTKQVFKQVQYAGKVTNNSLQIFKAEYTQKATDNAFPKSFNGYYDHYNISPFDFKNVKAASESTKLETLFSDQTVDHIYTSIALQKDLATLNEIANNKAVNIKTFDYDGQKYTQKQASQLINTLNVELHKINNQINDNNIAIYAFFKRLAQEQGKVEKLNKLYKRHFNFDKEYDIKFDLHTRLSHGLEFMNESHPHEDIRHYFHQLLPLENELKTFIVEFLDKKKFQPILTPEIVAHGEAYISKEWVYFGNTRYYDNSITILANAMDSYLYVLSKSYFVFKRNLLVFQEELVDV